MGKTLSFPSLKHMFCDKPRPKHWFIPHICSKHMINWKTPFHSQLHHWKSSAFGACALTLTCFCINGATHGIKISPLSAQEHSKRQNHKTACAMPFWALDRALYCDPESQIWFYWMQGCHNTAWTQSGIRAQNNKSPESAFFKINVTCLLSNAVTSKHFKVFKCVLGSLYILEEKKTSEKTNFTQKLMINITITKKQHVKKVLK